MAVLTGLVLIVAGIVLLVLGAGDQVNCVTTPCPQPEGSTPLRLAGAVLVLCGAGLSLGGAIRAWRGARRQ